MKEKTSKVDIKGRVTVPHKMRFKYGFTPGKLVYFEELDDGVMIGKSKLIKQKNCKKKR